MASSCPKADQLRQLLLGNLAEPEAETVSDHLATCTKCLKTVESLQLDDSLVQALRKGAPVASQAQQAVQQGLLEKVKTLASTRGGNKKNQDVAEAATVAPDVPLREVSQDTSPSALEQTGGVEADTPAFDFLAPPQKPDEIGRLGAYRILKVLGHGGMGVVFLAEDEHLQRSVALKAMLPEIAQKAAAKDRFLREARAAAKLEHDHIVPIYQVSEDRGVPFIAMPFLKGLSLDDWLKQRKGKDIRLSQILKIGREIARGLAAAHDKRLVHRDIKPGNIWLDANAAGRVKILDFGLARATTGEQNLTQSGVIVGTPSYMAPEQAQSEKIIDGRADLFSLGVILYRLCTGELPFKGNDMLSTLMSLATHEPPPPSKFNADLPPALSDLITRLLSKDPKGRPASAKEVAQTLQAIEKACRNKRPSSSPPRRGASAANPAGRPYPPP